MLLIIESGIALSGSIIYFLHTGKKRIAVIEKYTKNYSINMAEAFADVASLSYKAKKSTRIKLLFQKKIRENTIDEAFFALNNGTLVAHSSKKIEKELKGNIANDEFSYNVDMILWPSRRRIKEVQFTDYNIISKRVPFRRDYRMLIKKHLYSKIESPGWLVSRAVFVKNKPVGTVNFIISRDRIYNFIKSHFEKSKKVYFIAQAIALIISLIVSLVVLLRYRSIQDETFRFASLMDSEKAGDENVIEIVPDREISSDSLLEVDSADDDYITIDLNKNMDDDMFKIEIIEDGNSFELKSGFELDEQQIVKQEVISGAYNEDKVSNTGQVIKDAIPLMKKEVH